MNDTIRTPGRRQPDAIQRQLLERSGWQRYDTTGGETGWITPNGRCVKDSAMPPISLDVMHELIMQRPASFRKAMRFHLYEITDQMSAHFANAAQMAEAFIRTERDHE